VAQDLVGNAVLQGNTCDDAAIATCGADVASSFRPADKNFSKSPVAEKVIVLKLERFGWSSIGLAIADVIGPIYASQSLLR
jgi:hypothetical protein